MSTLIITFNPEHKMHKDYVIGCIHGLAMGCLYRNNFDKPKHFGIIRDSDNNECHRFDGTDEEINNIIELVNNVYGGNAYKGLFKFSGTYPWND